jgi:DNA-binding response OmpR family regulator
MSVKADELIRKPFQPQDLIARVKNLLHAKSADPSAGANAAGEPAAAPRTPPPALNSLFYTGPSPAAPPGHSSPRATAPLAAQAPVRPATPTSAPRAAVPAGADVQKLRNEIHRLELLVKKLQAELEAKNQYCTALEAHITTLQDSD